MSPSTNFGEKNAAWEEARIVILPVPYDLSLSFRPGARLGPEAIIQASSELEPYLFELGVTPEDYGIFTAPAVPWVAGDAKASHAAIASAAQYHLAAGKWVLALGGDHSVSYPLIQAHKNPDLTVLQLDAHGDLYPGYQGSLYSHAAPMYRLVQAGYQLVQVGQRVLSRYEQALIQEQQIPFFPARSLQSNFDPAKIVAALPMKVYITLDLDVLDPSQMPSVGTPLPGGLSYIQLMEILSAVFAEREVVGMDLVEFSPSGDFHAAMTAAQIAYETLGLLGTSRGWV